MRPLAAEGVPGEVSFLRRKTRAAQNPHPSQNLSRCLGCLQNVGQPQLLVPSVKTLESSQ